MTAPVGLLGYGKISSFVLGVMAARSWSAELILGAGGNMHGHAAGQLGDRLIADKARLRDDDLIPGLDHRTDGQVDGLAAADGDQDVFLFIVQIKAAL